MTRLSFERHMSRTPVDRRRVQRGTPRQGLFLAIGERGGLRGARCDAQTHWTGDRRMNQHPLSLLHWTWCLFCLGGVMERWRGCPWVERVVYNAVHSWQSPSVRSFKGSIIDSAFIVASVHPDCDNEKKTVD